MKQLPIRILDSSVDNIPLLRSMHAKLQAIHLIPPPPARTISTRLSEKRRFINRSMCERLTKRQSEIFSSADPMRGGMKMPSGIDG
jgi:hypothetical protein